MPVFSADHLVKAGSLRSSLPGVDRVFDVLDAIQVLLPGLLAVAADVTR